MCVCVNVCVSVSQLLVDDRQQIDGSRWKGPTRKTTQLDTISWRIDSFSSSSSSCFLFLVSCFFIFFFFFHLPIYIESTIHVLIDAIDYRRCASPSTWIKRNQLTDESVLLFHLLRLAAAFGVFKFNSILMMWFQRSSAVPPPPPCPPLLAPTLCYTCATRLSMTRDVVVDDDDLGLVPSHLLPSVLSLFKRN